jgi:hypothetical protein
MFESLNENRDAVPACEIPPVGMELSAPQSACSIATDYRFKSHLAFPQQRNFKDLNQRLGPSPAGPQHRRYKHV